MKNYDDGITSGDFVSYGAGSVAKAAIGPIAATTVGTALGTGVIATAAVFAAPFVVAGAVGWAVGSAWDSLTDLF